MINDPAPLRLHAYSGREHGLMVVGSRLSLKTLGQQLIAAADAEPASPPSRDWPVEVARPTVVGPYVDIPEFRLSFHLEGESPAADVLPLRRSGPPTVLLIAVAVCAAVGLVTLVGWLLVYAL